MERERRYVESGSQKYESGRLSPVLTLIQFFIFDPYIVVQLFHLLSLVPGFINPTYSFSIYLRYLIETCRALSKCP